MHLLQDFTSPKKFPLLYSLLIHPFIQSQFWETKRRAQGYTTLSPLKEQSKRSTSLLPKAACSSFNFNVMRTTYYYTLLNIICSISIYVYIHLYLPLGNQTRALQVFPQSSLSCTVTLTNTSRDISSKRSQNYNPNCAYWFFPCLTECSAVNIQTSLLWELFMNKNNLNTCIRYFPLWKIIICLCFHTFYAAIWDDEL